MVCIGALSAWMVISATSCSPRRCSRSGRSRTVTSSCFIHAVVRRSWDSILRRVAERGISEMSHPYLAELRQYEGNAAEWLADPPPLSIVRADGAVEVECHECRFPPGALLAIRLSFRCPPRVTRRLNPGRNEVGVFSVAGIDADGGELVERENLRCDVRGGSLLSTFPGRDRDSFDPVRGLWYIRHVDGFVPRRPAICSSRPGRKVG